MTDIRAGLAGKLPPGDGNGLHAIAALAAKDHKRLWVCVALVDVQKLEQDYDREYDTARMRIRRVEPIVDAGDAAELQRILQRAWERRSGNTVLPIDLEKQVEAAFRDLDPDTFNAERDEREAAEEPVEHTGAGEDWADELREMNRELGYGDPGEQDPETEA